MSRVSKAPYTLPAALALSIVMPGMAHATCLQANIVRASAVADATTGDILRSTGNIDAEFHPASITKLISSLVIFEALRNGQFRLDQQITVGSAQDGYGGDRLRAGTVMTLENALRVSSASQNGVYNGIASAYPGGQAAFVARMNEISRIAGAEHTNFINPNGLFQFGISQNCALHHTTIRDLFRILHYAQREYPNELERYYGQARLTYNSADPNVSSLPPLNPTSALLADQANIEVRDGIDINFVKTGFIRYSGAHIFASGTINGRPVYGIETGMTSGPSSEIRGYRIRDVALLNDFRAVRGEFPAAAPITVASVSPPSYQSVTSTLSRMDPVQLVGGTRGPIAVSFNMNFNGGDLNEDGDVPNVRYLMSYRTAAREPMADTSSSVPVVSSVPAPVAAAPTTTTSTRDNFLPASLRGAPPTSVPRDNTTITASTGTTAPADSPPPNNDLLPVTVPSGQIEARRAANPPVTLEM